ncbi:hypothetical protein P3T76_012697 [Phytophthora citrophthora]|uniref:Uncharacterized protein n=1 Tax=Phytophthora citrophthora TaxID=4793 RepID=A0AAD9G4X3_9STRA|nr:hypothetical protein P3T76_012697 [Phytophthora citrophthora]
MVMPLPQAAKRSLMPPSGRRSPKQSATSSIGDLSTSVQRPVAEREEEQAKMDTFVFFTMMR